MRLTTSAMIYETHAVRISRGLREGDGLPIVVKSLPPDARSLSQRGRIKYEHELLTLLASHGVPNVLRPVALIEEGGEIALVTHDGGGWSLRTLMPLTLQEVLHVAVRLTRALAGAHRLGITHKDINPDNAVFNRATGVVELIDFGISSRLEREAQPLTSPSAIEGTVAYVSPEQTGRMTRMLDYRSDFYSLGVTLYELLCGVLPFEHEDLTQLVHAHLALRPRPPVELAPHVPGPLNDLVMKLLEKAPEGRYQSADGLLHDLQRIAAAIAPGGAVEPFELGAQDFSATFQVPEKIYGREAESAQVSEVYAQVARGGRALLMVSGASGIGKSSLVNSLHAALTEKNGLFAAGKHEQLRRHVPLSALASAIEQAVRRVLLAPEATFALWQRRTQEALGHVGQSMIDLVPALELLVGKQPPAPELPPQETENRVMYLLDRLLRTFSSEQPLVVFLDDLQWADSATFKFLARWRNDTHGSAGLMLVGAYRSEEVGATHPLRAVLDDLRAAGLPVPTIALAPMREADIAALLRDATHTQGEAVTALAALLLSKTAGNAFFVREFVRDLARAGKFTFDAAQRRWVWDLEAIRGTAATHNVLEFMTERIRTLGSAMERDTLAAAACFGQRFTLQNLASLSGRPIAEVRGALQPSLEAGFVVPQGQGWRYSAQLETDATFAFIHDKVHEAAASLLTGEALMRTHRAIGMVLWDGLAVDKPDSQLFSAVDHLNHAQPLLNAQEQERLATLNERAAEEAQRAAANDIAAVYWDRALRFFTEQQSPRRRAVELRLAYCEYLAGRSQQADARLERLIADSDHRHDKQERLSVQRIRAKCFAAIARYDDAVASSIEALGILGTRLPRRAHLGHVVLALIKLQGKLKGRPVESLADAAPIADPRMLTLLDLLYDMAPATYFTDSNMYGVVVLTMGQIALEHGNSSFSPFIYGSLTAVYATTGDYALANRYARAARSYMDRMQVQNAKDHLVVDVSIGYSALHVRDQHKRYMQSAMDGLAAGDLVNATNSIGLALNCWAFSSREELSQSLADTANLNAQMSGDFLTYRRHFVQTEKMLRGATRPGSMDDETFTEAEELQRIANHQVTGVVPLAFHLHRCLCGVYTRQLDKAVESGFAALEGGILQRMGEHNAFYFDCLFAMALGQQAQVRGALSSRCRKQLQRICKRMAKLAAEEPFVAMGASKLAAAELAALGKRPEAADVLYEESTRLLPRTGYNGFCALAHECAARHFFRRGIESAAQAHLRAAVAFFGAWGAPLRVEVLRKEFGDVGEVKSATTHSKTTATGAFSEGVDLPALMRATQALSSEMVVERLSQKIVQISQELAGATHAVLLLIDGQGQLLPQGPPCNLPKDIINYVSRTREAVVADDAVTEARWSKDAYLQRARPRSLLCAPLLQQGVLRGAIYMENALAPKMFSLDRVALVKMLAVQAAVSLDNARLYEDLENKVASRTEELRDAHARLVRAQRDAAELNMAGGFAHEMLNALSVAQYTLTDLNEGSEADNLVPLIQGLRDRLSSLTQAEMQSALQDLQASLRVVGTGVRRGLEVTKQTLRYAEVSGLLPGSDKLRVQEVVDRVAGDMAQTLASSNIQLTTEIPPDASMVASQEHVATILRNLLDNARDAMAARGPDAPRRLTVRCQREQGVVAVTVQDSGVGMDEMVRRRVFEPFFSTKGAAGKGLGLGLSRKIAQLYGGDLQFTSEAGKGTTFKLTLPQTPSSNRSVS